MLRAALIPNALAGLDDAYVSNERIHYRTETIGSTGPFTLDPAVYGEGAMLSA